MAKAEYPADEFDDIEPGGRPVGVHRATPKGWVRLVSILSVFAIAGGLAYGTVLMLYYADDIPFLQWLTGQVPEEQVSIPTFPTESPTPTASPSPSPSADVRYGVSVAIYNDSGISGLARDTREFIRDAAPFDNIDVGTWDGASPPGNVIRYLTEDYHDTAHALADILGIAVVSQGPTEGTSIEIVLVSNPLPQPSPSPSATPSP